MDLTAAYNIIWQLFGTLACFASKCLPLGCVQTVELLLRNRHFQVHVGDCQFLAKAGEQFASGLCPSSNIVQPMYLWGGSVSEWLACLTQAQNCPGSNHSHDYAAGEQS